MQLTRRGEYGLRVMLDLATQPPEQLVSSKEIAERQKISPKFIPQIVHALSRAGLIQSARGHQGGIKLAGAARKINLKLIIEAIEGPIALNSCLLKHRDCELRYGCPLRPVWARAQNQMLSVLESTTLADLVEPLSAA